MIELLFISLLFLLLFDIILRGFDALRPAIWVIIGFLIGALFGILNKNNWGDISLYTYTIIIFFTFIFYIFSFAGDRIKFTRILNKIEINRHFPKYLVILINLIMLITGILYLDFMYKNSLLAGNPGGWFQMFSYARLAEQMGIALEPSFILSLFVKLSYSFGYVQTYIVIKDIIYHKYRKIRFIDVISSILYFIHTFVSGGRTKMIYFFIFIIVVGLILYRNKMNWTKKSIMMGIKYVFFGLIIVIISFWLIEQTVRGSIYGNRYSLWYQMSKYMGSPIYALDIYLKNPSYMSSFYETETLYSIISVLNKMGLSIPFNNNALEFISFANGQSQVITNIYTAIRRYVHDYNISGLIILTSFQSIFYSAMYSNIRRNRSDDIELLFYGIIIYPVAFYFIEERFLNDLFTLTMIFQYIMIIIFVLLLRYFGSSETTMKNLSIGD